MDFTAKEALKLRDGSCGQIKNLWNKIWHDSHSSHFHKILEMLSVIYEKPQNRIPTILGVLVSEEDISLIFFTIWQSHLNKTAMI